MYAYSGEVRRALEFYNQALLIKEKTLGSDHLESVTPPYQMASLSAENGFSSDHSDYLARLVENFKVANRSGRYISKCNFHYHISPSNFEPIGTI